MADKEQPQDVAVGSPAADHHIVLIGDVVELKPVQVLQVHPEVNMVSIKIENFRSGGFSSVGIPVDALSRVVSKAPKHD